MNLRLWSAGCATGEEPYSLAILVSRLLPDLPDWTVTILATDINPEALQAARKGRYRTWSLRATPEDIQSRYFRQVGTDQFDLHLRIKDMVAFAPLNLVHDGYPTTVTNTNAMDVILCRNVLMYFSIEAQRAASERLTCALASNGWLIVSPAEASADLLKSLQPVNFPGAIFFQKKKEAVSGITSLPETTWPIETSNQLPLPSFEKRPGERPGEHPWLPSHRETPVPPQKAPKGDSSPDPQALVQQARAMANRGWLDEAGKLCQAALVQERLDVEAYLLMAAICQEQGETASAQNALRRALFLDPRSAPAHFLLGSLLFRTKDHQRARRCMETVIHLVSVLPRDQILPAGEGLTAGRLLETAQAYLASQNG